MCGLSGYVDFRGRPFDELRAALARMHAALGHRGPDGSGIRHLHGDEIVEICSRTEARRTDRMRIGAAVGLAHHRLAIIDPSSVAAQPMVSASRASWLTYNGEIYNHRELRHDRLAGGTSFRSSSDTEVLLELLEAEQLQALDRLRGMFAFAWWDEGRQRLTLARDRFGIKPLVYATPAPGLVLFASEPRALAASGYVAAEIADGALGEYLARGSIDVRSSFWKDVTAVGPGEYVTFDGNASPVRRQYWSLEDVLLKPTARDSASSIARKVGPAILQSVEAHLVSDVPVAVFLSGGLDSTAVLCAASRVSNCRLRTFTVTMPDTPLDEAQHARIAARRAGSEHMEVSLGDLDIDASLDEFFAAMQTPTIDGFNTFLVARAARDSGVRVALSGMGGDELFGGYATFQHAEQVTAAFGRYGPAARAVARLIAPWWSSAAARLGAPIEWPSHPAGELWWRSRRLFNDVDVENLSGCRSAPPALSRKAGSFEEVRYREVRHFLASQLLRDTDAFTMCRALELRTPFVDHVLFERVIEAGIWRRAPGLSFKSTLFRFLPELSHQEALDRRKQGFVLPFDHWIRDALTQRAPRVLRDLKPRLHHPRYQPILDRFLSRRAPWQQVWALYVLERMGTAGAPAARASA